MDAVSVVNQRGANLSSKDTDHISQPLDHLPMQQTTSFTLRDLHFIVKFAQVRCIAGGLQSAGQACSMGLQLSDSCTRVIMSMSCTIFSYVKDRACTQ